MAAVHIKGLLRLAALLQLPCQASGYKGKLSLARRWLWSAMASCVSSHFTKEEGRLKNKNSLLMKNMGMQGIELKVVHVLTGLKRRE